MDDADKRVETPETETEESEKEIKEVDAVESDKAEESEKRESFFKEIKNGFKDFWEKSKKFVRDTAQTVNGYFSAQQEINALDKLFEEEAEKFTDVKTGRKRYAILSDDGSSLLLRRRGRRRSALRQRRRNQTRRPSVQQGQGVRNTGGGQRRCRPVPKTGQHSKA